MASTDLHTPDSKSLPAAKLPRIGGFTLLDKIYDGSISTLYRARQDRLGRVVALKTLREWPPPSDIVLERFNRATYVAAQVVHPNLPVLYETGTYDGYHYAALEYVAGQTLQEVLQERARLTERRTVWIGLQVARALQALHERGILHRNVKPKNILLDLEGRAKLIGLGLAKCDAACFSKSLDAQAIGTPHFMAPEMIRGVCNDPRSDLYSLGVTLYVMVAGRPPFEKGMPAVVMAKHLYEKPVALPECRADLSREFHALVEHLMAKCPGDRVASAREAVQRLETLYARHPYPALGMGAVERPRFFRPRKLGLAWKPFVTALLLVLCLGATGYFAWQSILAGMATASSTARTAPLASAAAPRATSMSALPAPPGATFPAAPRATPLGLAPAPAPEAENQAQRSQKMEAEYRRLMELDDVFRRDRWRGVREWEEFLRLYPNAPDRYRAEAKVRTILFRKLDVPLPEAPRKGLGGEDLEF